MSALTLFVVLCSFLLILSQSDAFHNFADISCGVNNVTHARESKIVGGKNAIKSEFPWLVSITRRGGHFCGGSLINNKYILTAGHCLCTGIGTNILKPANIKITLAQYDLTNKQSDAYERTIKTIIVHPGYICNKPKDDIAILELWEKLTWSESVSPACLPMERDESGHQNIDNSLALVAGWGWTNEDSSKGGRANVLQKASVNVYETTICNDWFRSQGKKTKIQETQICAGHKKGGIDACWADSGGPLMVGTEKPDQMMVVGVVSTGIGCARPALPGLYTRVSKYISWIRKNIDF